MLREKRFVILIVLILILLVTNWITWSSTREMQEKLNRMQSNLNNLSSNISTEISGIRGVVQQIKNNDRWWTPPEVEIQDLNKEKAKVKLSWTLKEYNEGSKVTLNYQGPGQQEFTPVIASETTKGHFFVVLPVDIPGKPLIDIQVKKVSKTGKASRIVEESGANDSRNFNLKYYIAVQNGKTVHTSDKRSLNLDKLRYKVYDPLSLEVSIDSDEIVATAHCRKPETSLYKAKNIFLETRQGNGNKVEQWPLEPEKLSAEKELKIYRARVTPTRDYDSLYLVVNYSGGKQVERKIE